jgi:hypothetical protein
MSTYRFLANFYSWISMIIFFVLIGFWVASCNGKIHRELYEVEEMKSIHPSQKYLKIHMHNGHLFVLNNWLVDEEANNIIGWGKHLNPTRKEIENRSKAKDDYFEIGFSDILILETNDKGTNPGVATMVVAGIITIPSAVYCLFAPKACFGSCPTFFVPEENGEKLVAEGFSSSISRSLEATDVDFIAANMPIGEPFQLTVKNEALETHLLRSINILEIPKASGNRIVKDVRQDFYEIKDMLHPSSALYNGYCILFPLLEKDEVEWFSLANEVDLNTKEEIFLEFPNPGNEFGILIDKRQSLMTTFLFYQLLAWMGPSSTFYLTEMELHKPYLKRRIEKMYDLLGGIEVHWLNDKNKWIPIETVREAGPIVSDVHFIPLPIESSSNIVKVKLRLTQGLWRINEVKLATVVGQVQPNRLAPIQVMENNRPNSKVLAQLNSQDYLVTFPGDIYTLYFPATVKAETDYFIESTGYYIEWMREEWMPETNFKLARRVLLRPSWYLRAMSPYFKEVEPHIEEIFWNSKYTKP